jgi:flagellin
MALSVGTNTGALMAQAAATSTNKSMENSMERLATGKRINSASDDAAGVAIASRLTSEIRGTNQAIRNAMDGQAMLDTAEGAHQEVENILQRMREISVQAANGTNNADDRANLQLEMDQLTTEIDRISSTTTWAGQKLIDGTGKFQLQVGSATSAADNITASITSISSATLGVGAGGTATTAANAATLAEAGTHVLTVGGTPAAGDVYKFTVGSEALQVRVDKIAAELAVTNVAAQTNGTSATFATSTAGVHTITTTATASTGADAFDLTINGVSFEIKSAASQSATQNAARINAALANNDLGISATASGAVVTITEDTGYSVKVGTNAFVAQTAIAKNGVEGVATAIATEIGDRTSAAYVGLTATAAADGSVTLNSALQMTGTLTISGDTSAVATVNAAGTELTMDTTAATTTDTVAFSINGSALTTGVLSSTDKYEDNAAGIADQLNDVIAASALFSQMGLVAAVTGSEAIKITATKLTTDLIKDVSVVAASTTAASSALSVKTNAGATSAIDKIDLAIKSINNQRATLGSISNRLDSTVSNLTNISANLSAGRGRIEDADFAAETTNLAKTQILQQASTAMLAQANASKQGVLSLLQG